MTKYYTVALGTPIIYRYGQRPGFKNATRGFLFHDSNGISITQVHKALYVLSELFEDTKPAFAIKHNEKEIFATLSMRGLPTPTKVMGSYWNKEPDREFLRSSELEGWIIPDVKDASRSPEPIVFNELYETCETLDRIAGNCPCARVDDSSCLQMNIVEKRPELGPHIHSDHLIDHAVLKRAAFREVAGFKWVSSKKTTTYDFEKSFRPLGTHDFDIIDARTDVLSKRSKQRHLSVKYRETECTKCVFSYVYKDRVVDCGALKYCGGPVSDAEVWALMYDNYRASGFDNMPNFSKSERDFLIEQAGRQVLTEAITNTRSIAAVLGGFVQVGDGFAYRVSAARGDRTREVHIDNYADLNKAVGGVLPATPGATQPLGSRTLLACYAFSNRYGYGYNATMHKVVFCPSDQSVEATIAKPTHMYEVRRLSPASTTSNFFTELFGRRYADAHEMVKRMNDPATQR